MDPYFSIAYYSCVGKEFLSNMNLCPWGFGYFHLIFVHWILLIPRVDQMTHRRHLRTKPVQQLEKGHQWSVPYPHVARWHISSRQ